VLIETPDLDGDAAVDKKVRRHVPVWFVLDVREAAEPQVLLD
jgi:hypothetical protein